MKEKRRTLLKLGAACLALAALTLSAGRARPSETAVTAEALSRETEEIDRLNADRGKGTAVEPLLPIEQTWDIEDEHAEAAGPLVTWMTMGGQELGFDRETNTFYCTLGMEGEDWPELPLTAGGAEGLRAAWVDDYAWDGVRDSIRDNVPYRLIAWTEDEYAYFRLVFTGLPVVTLHVTDYDGLGDDYMPARCTFSAAGYEGVDMPARTHLRSGGYSKRFDKWSYRVEFQRRTNKGRYSQQKVSLLGEEPDSDWLLISNASDDTLVRNHLGMELWKKWNPDGGVGVLESRLVEVFVQDQYMGIYQLLQRIDPRKEIAKLGGNLSTDGVSRIIKAKNIGERPVWRLWDECNFVLEMRWTGKTLSLDAGKKIFADFVESEKVKTSGGQLSGEAFAALAERCADARQVIGYFLFTQAAGLPYDNVFNNVYVYGVLEGGRYVYRLSPWDMDMGFQQLFRNQKDNLNEWMELPTRMLNLDVAGARRIAWDTWEEKRASILSEDAIYEWMTGVETLVNDSGAFLRETEKWDGGGFRLNIEPLRYFTIEHMDTIGRYLQEEWMLRE